MAGLLALYGALLLTGFPLWFLIAHSLWSALTRRWGWDRRRKLLVANALGYPLVFAALYLIVVRTFGISAELERAITSMVEVNSANVRAGGDPQQNNWVLGAMFFGLAYYGAAVVPVALVGLVYSCVSTVMILRAGEHSRWHRPFVGAGAASALAIAAAYAARTPIFNLLRLF